MNPVADLTGARFGRLVATEFAGHVGKYKRRAWRTRCECGREVVVTVSNLRSGNTKSCGCLDREVSTSHLASVQHLGAAATTKHGDAVGRKVTPEYNSWSHMLRRCNAPMCVDYPDYGGRGIRVCERWSDYANFLADMGRKPSPRHSIDRIDVNGNYEPGNCRWATDIEQANNRRPRGTGYKARRTA